VYKVTKLMYTGETTKDKHSAFTKYNTYYVYKSKDGSKTMLTTDTFDKCIFDDKLTVQRRVSEDLLKKFVVIETLYFKNQKEFKQKIRL
jgi:hypothetical protein